MPKKLKLNGSMKTYKTLQNQHPKKDVLFITGDWNAKAGSQETPGVTGKFSLGVQGLLVDPKSSTGALSFSNTVEVV